MGIYHILREVSASLPVQLTGQCEGLQLWNGQQVRLSRFCFSYLMPMRGVRRRNVTDRYMKRLLCFILLAIAVATGRVYSANQPLYVIGDGVDGYVPPTMEIKNEVIPEPEPEPVVVKVSEPGTLNMILWEMDNPVDYLVIEGALNSDDLRYIADGNGVLADVKILDLSKVTLIPGGESYAKVKLDVDFGGGTGYFCISPENDSEITQNGNWLGLPTGVKVYRSDCFAGLFGNLKKLETVKLPDYITEIGPYAFAHCTALKKVETGDKVIKIGEAAFLDTGLLKSFSLPSSVKIIDYKAFKRSGIESLSLPASVESIRTAAFSGSKIREINIDNVRELGEDAFSGTNLEEVTLADGIVRIEDRLFERCVNLKSVAIPASVRSVGPNAFTGTFWLENHPGEDGVVYINNVAYRIKADKVGSVLTFKEGTTIINDNFCYGHYYGSTDYPVHPKDIPVSSFNIVLPSSVKEIGINAFENITKLKKIEWPDDGLEIIRGRAFYGCTNFGFSSLPNSLREIGGEAFRKCNGIFKLTFGPNLQHIYSSAFADCNYISEVELHTPALTHHLTEGYGIFNKYQSNNVSIKKVVIGKEVELVPERFLYGCEALNEVIFENRDDRTPLVLSDYSISSYKHNAIRITNCPKGISYIGDYVFYNTILPDGIDLSQVEYIGYYAFGRAVGLPSTLVLAAPLKDVGYCAFANCEEIKTVVYEVTDYEEGSWGSDKFGWECTGMYCSAEGNLSITKAIIGKDVERLPYGLFSYCVNLESIEFEERNPENAKPLVIPRLVGDPAGNDAELASKVSNWVLPYGTTVVLSTAFDSSICSLELPETFTEFRYDGFRSTYIYKNLRTIICHAVEVPIGFNLFPIRDNYNSLKRYEDVDVYVPAQSVEAYKADTRGWGRCSIFPLQDGVDDTEISGDTLESIHTSSGVKLPRADKDNLAPGIYIFRYKSGKTKKIAIQ